MRPWQSEWMVPVRPSVASTSSPPVMNTFRARHPLKIQKISTELVPCRPLIVLFFFKKFLGPSYRFVSSYHLLI